MAPLKLLITTLTPLLVCLQTTETNAQNFQSPCPRLFTYDTTTNETDTWYGTVTLLSDSDLLDVWLRLTFDRAALQLGNWFGQIETSDSKEFHIRKNNHELKANVPHRFRFFLKYNPNAPAPRLLSFRLNGKLVCSAGTLLDATFPNKVHTQSDTSSRDTIAFSSNANRTNANFQNGVNSHLSTNSSVELGVPLSANSQNVNVRDEKKPQLDSNLLDKLGISTKETVPPRLDTNPRDKVNTQFVINSQRDANSTDSRDTPITAIQNDNDICGTVLQQPRPLIAYGETTHDGEFPWHAALYVARNTKLTYICGASLISRNYVVTAANCVIIKTLQEQLKPEELLVQLGKYNLKRFSVGYQDRPVSKIIPHPQYSAETYLNDIALLKLETPADITEFVRPVCLWQESTDITTVHNKIGRVVGWGYDETGRVSEELMQANMPVVPKDKCVSSYPAYYTRFTSPNSYCAGFANGTSPCNGDAGDGMIFPLPDSNRYNPVWQLRGLASILPIFQNQSVCDVTHYAIFTDVAKYLDWIAASMK